MATNIIPVCNGNVRDSAWRYVTILDLPFSLVFDTLLLPIDIHHGPYE
ncbi:putative lipoprotein [Escherichia coli]|uniref:Putative lipoprotein n=1 Tax=Escherichia coli TaxID=562 RepID=A0A2X1JG02_ECOLX|nr:putative lipoprotein [Escherichia coli]